jgi:hypothetical protein
VKNDNKKEPEAERWGAALLPIGTLSVENVIIFGEAAAKQAAT